VVLFVDAARAMFLLVVFVFGVFARVLGFVFVRMASEL
jgi:hypothetical protein